MEKDEMSTADDIDTARTDRAGTVSGKSHLFPREDVVTEDDFFPENEHLHNGFVTRDDLTSSQLAAQRTKYFVIRFLKGFGSGIGVYTAIKAVTALMRNPFRKSLPSMAAVEVAKDGLRFATFLGLYPSLYDLVVELLELRRGEKDDWNSAIAGGVSGLAIFVEDATRRHIYCLFAIARAVGAIVSTLVRRRRIPAVPYSETGLFCACTAFLVYCTALKPQYLLPGYYRSVLKWSRDYTDDKLTTLFRKPGPIFLSCADVELHSHKCLYHAVVDFLQSFPSFAKLYLPIHLAPIVFTRYKSFFKRPKRSIKTLLKNVLWSTCFLCTMVMLAKYVICLLRNLQHRPPPLSPWIPAVAGSVAGLGVLFERVHRRKELSLFLIPHTLYAVYLWGKESRVLKHVKHSSVFLFALSMVPIMHAYEREPDSLSLLIHSALKYFVGKRISTKERERRRLDSEMMAS